jgi:hypothetical protein
MEQHEIGRAVVADVLGAQWADALVGPASARSREATVSSQEKKKNSNARVITRRNST